MRVFCPLFQMPRGSVLALPRRTLQRAGISARRPSSNYNLPGGKSLPHLCHHRGFNIHQQEVCKTQKGSNFGVSPFLFPTLFARPRLESLDVLRSSFPSGTLLLPTPLRTL